MAAPAARLGDPIAHSNAMTGLITGLVVGAVVGAAIIATGGLALVAVAGAAAAVTAGAGLGDAIGGLDMCGAAVTGTLATGSDNVFINTLKAVRAHLDTGLCSQHGPVPSLQAQGSASVFVNAMPLARKGDMLTCSAKVHEGSPNVFIGGETVTTDAISPEIPDWVHWTLLGVGLASAVVLAGPVVAVVGLAGGFLGGKAGEYIGGEIWGAGSDGQKISALVGSIVGGVLGAKGASGVLNRAMPTPGSAGAAFVKGGAPGVKAFNTRKANTLAAGERPLNCKTCVGEPIDVVTGDVIMQQTDLDVAGRLPVTLTRTHTSGNLRGTLFGPAWICSWGQWIEVVDETHVIFHAEDGASYRFAIGRIGQTVRHPVWQRVALTPLHDGFKVSQRGRADLYFHKRDFPHWRLSAIIDRAGDSIALIYANMELAEVRHSGGLRIAVHAEQGRIHALGITESDGSETTLMQYQYDAAGHLVGVINDSGKALQFSYDSNGRLAGWRDRNGKSFAWRYDGFGRCIIAVGDDGYLNGSLRYDDDAQTNYYTDACGHTTAYHYDSSGSVVRTVDPMGGIAEFAFDAHQNLTLAVLPGGAVLRRELDEHGRLVSYTDAADRETVIEWDEADRPIADMAPDGMRTAYRYDELGRPVWRTVADAVTEWHYQADTVTICAPGGAVNHLRLDGHGRVIALTDSAGRWTRFRRDSLGYVRERIDAHGQITRYDRTTSGKLSRITLPDGSIHRAEFDAEGNRVRQIDALGRETILSYGPFDSLTAATEPGGGTTAYAYDAEMRLIRVTNPAGQTWRYSYNPCGHLVEETDFTGLTTCYEVDPGGWVVAQVRPSGRRIDYRRNRAGQLLEKRCGDEVSRFKWDRAGRLASASNAHAHVVFERDALGRVVREAQNEQHFAYRYDAAGRRNARTAAGPGVDAHTSVWEFDLDGLPLEWESGDGALFSFEFDALGREHTRQLPGGMRIEQQHDALGRLCRQQVGKGQQTTWAHRVDYDGNGRSIRFGNSVDGLQEAALDADGVLLRAGEEAFAWDRAGNMIERIRHSSLLHEPGATDGLREHVNGRLTAAGRVRFEYDADGRMIRRVEGKRWGRQSEWRYQWNDDNRLVCVVMPGGETWRYRYDALGRRIAKVQEPSQPNAPYWETEFLWDGHVPAHERRMRKQADGHGGTAVLEDVISVWEYEPNSFRPLAKTDIHRACRPGEPERRATYSVITDHIGTPKVLFDEAGKIAWAATMDAWGAVQKQHENRTDCPLRFQGQYYDEESKLHYNWHRYYDPAVGRYLSPDPLGLAGGPNPYGYVDNPMVMIDPYGLAGFIFRGDSGYKGGPIGQPISGAVAATDIINHVAENGDGSLTSFSAIKDGSNGRRGASFFSDNVVKVSNDDLAVLESNGQIKIINTDAAREILMADPKVSAKEAKGTIQTMQKNNEVLIKGQIPASAVRKCK